jgi:hypothetical protein
LFRWKVLEVFEAESIVLADTLALISLSQTPQPAPVLSRCCLDYLVGGLVAAVVGWVPSSSIQHPASSYSPSAGEGVHT